MRRNGRNRQFRLIFVYSFIITSLFLLFEGESLGSVRDMQGQILEDYLRDFAKHAPLRINPKMVEA